MGLTDAYDLLTLRPLWPQTQYCIFCCRYDSIEFHFNNKKLFYYSTFMRLQHNVELGLHPQN